MAEIGVASVCMAIVAVSASAGDEAGGGYEWASAYYSDHAPVGSIWTGKGERSSFAQLVQTAGSAEFVILGEIHPNPDHHLLQARILRAIIGSGRRPALVFEMIPARYQGDLDEFTRSQPADAERLGELVDWELRGWPEWPLYQPIADIAVSAGLPIIAGDLDRDLIRRIGRDGRSALTGDQLSDFNLDEDLSEPINDRLREILKESHCDLVPDTAIDSMMLVQRVRDGAMAAAMNKALKSGADGAVLIAGAGHGRKDFGVPAVIRARTPAATVVSVGMTEVGPRQTRPSDYGPLDLFDFVLFTPREEVRDHCADLAEKLKSEP